MYRVRLGNKWLRIRNHDNLIFNMNNFDALHDIPWHP